MTEYERGLTAIARAHGVTLDDMRSACRKDHLCKARLDAYRYLRKRGWTVTRIGAYFHRDHTSIVWLLGYDRVVRRAKNTQHRATFYGAPVSL